MRCVSRIETAQTHLQVTLPDDPKSPNHRTGRPTHPAQALIQAPTRRTGRRRNPQRPPPHPSPPPSRGAFRSPDASEAEAPLGEVPEIADFTDEAPLDFSPSAGRGGKGRKIPGHVSEKVRR